MSIFPKAKTELPPMKTRADAFAYMLTAQLDNGAEPMDAAKRADEFASIFAKNMGLPDQPTPEGVEKYLQMVEKAADYCDRHPKVVEFVTGALTAAVGIFAGNKMAKDDAPSTPPPPPINMEELT
jgi:hypothetical protein